MQVAYLRIPATPPLMFYAEPGHIEVQGKSRFRGSNSSLRNRVIMMHLWNSRKSLKKKILKWDQLLIQSRPLSFGSNIRSLDSFNHLLKANRERFYTGMPYPS